MLDLFYSPRVARKGDKAGVSTQSQPIIVGYKVVDADAEDATFLEYIKIASEQGESLP